jgi:hypothetical protein
MSKHQSQSEMSWTTGALAAQIAAVRDECNHVVKSLSCGRNLSDATLAECVRLGDSLEHTHRSLKIAVAQIAISRRKRERAEPWII